MVTHQFDKKEREKMKRKGRVKEVQRDGILTKWNIYLFKLQKMMFSEDGTQKSTGESYDSLFFLSALFSVDDECFIHLIF